MSSSADALAERKASTRASVKSALRRLSDDDMASQSAAISRHVLASLSAFAPDETRAPDAPPLRLGLYVHCAKLREVDTAPLLAAALAHPRAELYLPIVDVDPEKARTPSMRFLRVRSLDDDLEPKTMGIMEPKETLADGAPRENLDNAEGPLDVLLMPGLAFEPDGRRLGRGGGFYDAFLERYEAKCATRGWTKPPFVALAYDAQMLEPGVVPAGAHDRDVDAIATAKGIVTCTDAGRAAVRRE